MESPERPCCSECGRPIPARLRPRRIRGRPSLLHDRPDEVAETIRLLRDPEAATALGVAPGTIANFRRKLGIPAPQRETCTLIWKTMRSGARRCHVRIPAEHWPFETGTRNGNSVYVTRATAIWNTAHPDDPVRRGEEIHHVDEDSSNDRLDNFQKLTRAAHCQLHGASPGAGLKKAA